LQLSKATVSKAVSRLEAKFGVRLFNRTSRRLSLTEARKQLAERAAHILAEAELAESESIANAAAPRGYVRLTAPMSFGILRVAPVLPEFLDRYPEVSIDLHLSDAHVDLIGEGYDAAVRIAALPDSSLVGRTLVAMPRYLVASPQYLEKFGRPNHPLRLTEPRCIGDDGRLEVVLPDWEVRGGAVHWVTPPGDRGAGRLPRREAVAQAIETVGTKPLNAGFRTPEFKEDVFRASPPSAAAR
jgi:DNA-binding transcriptional LysR family regulator